MSVDTILGVDPGTRFVGIAVVTDGKLIHYQVKTFLGPWSEKKLKAIVYTLASVIERYAITKVAVKIPDVLPTSLGFTQVIGTLNSLCDRKGIKPRYYTLSKIKVRWCKNKANSKELMAAVASKYPQLVLEHQQELRNKEGYYYKIFEAVAAAQMKVWRE
jgi:Holliday junction resolvasome RuvABC endonuclease subunit